MCVEQRDCIPKVLISSVKNPTVKYSITTKVYSLSKTLQNLGINNV